MKQLTLLSLGFFLLIVSSCNNYDKEGRLKIENLTSSSGTLKFAPMMHSDSASVLNFVPDTFSYHGKPFTGGIVEYVNDTLATIKGFLSNGIMDSTWQFYYKSGGLRMEGTLKNGYETGWWRSYYGYNKLKIEKLYDDLGFMLMRREYYDNGKLMNYQNINCPQFGNRERKISFTRNGTIESIYVEDSVLQLSPDELTERVGENLFMRKN